MTVPRLTEFLIETANTLGQASDDELHEALEALEGLEEGYDQVLRRLVTVPDLTRWLCTECGWITVRSSEPMYCDHKCDSRIVPVSPGLHRELIAMRAKANRGDSLKHCVVCGYGEHTTAECAR